MVYSEQNIDEFIFSDGVNIPPTEVGKRFLDFLLLKLFNRTEEELNDNDLEDGVLYPDGAKDYGIDACFIDANTLYIIQGKYRTEHNYTNAYQFLERIKDFFDLTDAKQLRQVLVPVYNAVHSDEITQIKIYYLTNNDITYERRSYSYEDKCIDKESYISNKVNKDISLKIYGTESFATIKTGILLDLPPEVKTATAGLVLENYFENRDKTSIVAEISLKSLASLVDKHHKYIFFSNIRDYKGLNAINKKIKETYELHPKDFWYFNNGITLVCKEYNLKQSYLTITAPQIVNGCQTASTIRECWRKQSEDERNNNQGTILIKIIKDLKEEKRKDITRYTNSQTAVTGKDFFALEGFHKELQNSFKEYGYFYEIQTNSAKNKTKNYPGNINYAHLFDKKFEKSNSFTAKEITQIFVAAILEHPGKAKGVGDFMPGGSQYDQVYNQDTPTDPRFYILPYGIWYYFKNIYNYNKNKIDKDRWKASLLFITKIFFDCISKVYFNNNANKLTIDFINKCDEIIKNRAEFDKFVRITFNVIIDFYRDSQIISIIGDNLPKFLKTAVEVNKEVASILVQKINFACEE
ncbi:MAG: AIPR family protein [Clostridiales bacterium]|nr:AIPR family protein [Clostridiales bacterium]